MKKKAQPNFVSPLAETMRLLIVLALLGAAAAAPGDPKKILVCGARQQGVGGTMGSVVKTHRGVQRAVS